MGREGIGSPPPNEHDAAVVVDSDATAAGAAVRVHLDAGRRAAGFVGNLDDPALAEFVSDVIRPDR